MLPPRAAGRRAGAEARSRRTKAEPKFMSATDTKSLIKTLLSKSDLMPETAEELREYLEEVERGPLDKLDEDYVHGLARRLGVAPGGAAPAAGPADPADPDDDDVEDAPVAAVWDDADDDDDDRLAELEDEIAAARSALNGAADSIAEAQVLLATIYDAEANTIKDVDPAEAEKALHGIDEALAMAAERTAPDA
jgi:hypothetical protein